MHGHQYERLDSRLWGYQAHLWQHKCIHFLHHDEERRGTSVHGLFKIILGIKLTSGKVLALSGVLHVPDIHWNLVSVFLLRKVGVRIMFGSNKIVLKK